MCCEGRGERRRNWQGVTKIIVSNRITEALKTAISLTLVTVKSPYQTFLLSYSQIINVIKIFSLHRELCMNVVSVHNLLKIIPFCVA